MKLTLYHDRASRSVRVRTVLEEIGIPYEVVPVALAQGETQSAAHRARHPLGQLPVLAIDGQPMIESVGICMWLAERFPEAELAPEPSSTERIQYHQWCAFVLGSLEPAITAEMVRRKEPSLLAYVASLADTLAVIDEPLRERQTLLQSGYSLPDLLIASTLHAIEKHGAVFSDPIARFLATIRARPAFERGHG